MDDYESPWVRRLRAETFRQISAAVPSPIERTREILAKLFGAGYRKVLIDPQEFIAAYPATHGRTSLWYVLQFYGSNVPGRSGTNSNDEDWTEYKNISLFPGIYTHVPSLEEFDLVCVQAALREGDGGCDFDACYPCKHGSGPYSGPACSCWNTYNRTRRR